MKSLPQDYVDIPSSLWSKGAVNVAGVVVDILPPFKTSGTSSCITFTIKDRDLDNGRTYDGLKVKYFNDNENYLPQVKLKDVILLRSIRVRQFNGKAVATAAQYEKILWAIFRPELSAASTMTPATGPIPFDPSYSEMKYAQSLLDSIPFRITVQDALSRARDSLTVTKSVQNPNHTSHRPFLLIKDVQEGTFVDLLCEIAKTYFNDGERAVLYVTDYTVNEGLSDLTQSETSYDDDRCGYLTQYMEGGPEPHSRMILQVTLWEPHATYAREHFQTKDLVWLTNVHIKRGRTVRYLEASIHTDRNYPQKIYVDTVQDETDSNVRELIRRRTQYWREHGGHPDDGTGRPKRSKKPPQQRKKRERREKDDQKLLSTDIVHFKRPGPNQGIKAINPDIPTRSIEDIISNESHKNVSPDNVKYTLPFQNLCYRTCARVVDFFPPDLKDFSVSLNGDMAVSPNVEDDGRSDDPIRWEWRFCLLLESSTSPPPGQAKDQMKVFVSGHDAVYLLGTDAVDLRRSSSALGELREKLFVLWGDLEELKRRAIKEGRPNLQSTGTVNSLPFVCCIKEYGVSCLHVLDPDRTEANELGCGHEDCLGWERRFAMFGTTIHS